jgi:glutathione S-transferase
MGAAARVQAAAALGWFDGQLQGRDWLAGDRFTMADIALLSIVDFGQWIGVAATEDQAALASWHARATARCA